MVDKCDTKVYHKSRGDQMSLDKAIEHHKEYRKPYRGAKAVDVTCRNHGSCPACYMNRTYANRKRLMESNDKLKEWRDNK